MSTAQTWRINSTGLDETLTIATKMGGKLRGGEVIELVGDLGAGKTTFVRGLARGMGSTDHVRSPSFTLGNVYSAPALTLYHFDFHRIAEAGIMRRELSEILDNPEAVVVVEWADIIADILPVEHLIIKISATSEEGRNFDITAPHNRSYMKVT